MKVTADLRQASDTTETSFLKTGEASQAQAARAAFKALTQ